MKVCHVTSVHQQSDTRIFHKQCCSLAQAGYEVHLVAYGSSSIQNGVVIHGLGDREKNRLRRILFGARKAIHMALSLDCDVYHLHDPELLPFIPKLKRAGKKVIFDSHEDVPQQILEKEWLPVRGPVSFLYSWLEKRNLKIADAVVGVTPHLVARLATINQRTVMITNYPILKQIKSLPTERSQESYICFVGRIAEDWNHLAIVEAIQSVDNVRYVLCGKVDNPAYIEHLKQADKTRKLDYRGIVSHDEVQNLYQRSLAGVSWLMPSPNIGGNLGTLGNNKLFEQMAAGIPVIISELDLWVEIINRHRCGLVVRSDDVIGFREAIQYLINNPQEAQEMGTNGRHAVEDEYNWEKQQEVLLTLYRTLKNE